MLAVVQTWIAAAGTAVLGLDATALFSLAASSP